MIALSKAKKMAEQIVGVLAPLCDNIAVAGSIRRHRPSVGDIDLVILPKDLTAVKDRCKKNAAAVKIDGDLNLIVILENGVQLDFFFARPKLHDLFTPRPSNWGTLFLCRTGSTTFNKWFAMQCEAKGYYWNPYLGIHGHEPTPGTPRPIIAGAIEDDMFAALDMDFIKPQNRER